MTNQQIYGAPQAIVGSELVTILQWQNGQFVLCSMPLSEVPHGSLTVNALAVLFATLPTTKPTVTGQAWNDGGVISLS